MLRENCIRDTLDNLFYSIALSGTGIDFTLNSSGSAALLAGYSAPIPISVNVQGGAYPYSVTLSCSGLPSYTVCNFSPGTVQTGVSGTTSTMTITSQFLTPGGTYPLTITGVSANGYSHSQQFQLRIDKPGLMLSANALDFSFQPVGTKSAFSTLTLTNTNVGTFNFSSITASGPFSQNNNCPSALLVYSSCSINISFAPTAVGPGLGSLTILDSVDGLSYSATLSGNGVDFAVTTSLTTLSLARGTSSSISVTVSPFGGSYSYPVSLSCFNLPIKTSCSFSPASFTPGNSSASSVLTISTDASATQAGTYTINIVGTSTAGSHSVPVQLTILKSSH